MRAERPGIKLDLGLEGEAWREEGFKRKSLARNPRGAAPAATTALYAATVQAIESGAVSPVPSKDARATLQTILASYQSARSGQTVAIDRS